MAALGRWIPMAEGLFAELLGQPQAVQLLEAALAQGRLAPAYLFAGPEGVGRALAARRFVEGISGAGLAGDGGLRRRLEQGNHPDLLWVEPTYTDKGQLVPASQARQLGLQKKALPQLRLEQIRELGRFLSRPPLEAPRSVVVLEGAERMAEAAANALLKTLEEPGLGLLILLTAAPERLLSTILSRCQRIPFRPLAAAQLQAVLARLPEPDPEAEPAAGPAGEPGPAAPEPLELLEMAAGSPGALLEVRRRWRELPAALVQRLQGLPREPMGALGLARDIAEALDTEQQLWLLGWWQLKLWRLAQDPRPQRRLEQLRRHLNGNVQPRLAWEVALLELIPWA